MGGLAEFLLFGDLSSQEYQAVAPAIQQSSILAI
jgi:hypothetical protein